MELVPRVVADQIAQYREIFPVVAILGPRQCGKSTLVKMLRGGWNDAIYLDLQDSQDINKLSEPQLFFRANADKIICLDEIQLMPYLFSVLRSEVDKKRTNGRFILMGSASRDLVQQSSETLAGRIGYIHLTPFSAKELNDAKRFDLQKFWFRGGFPNSFLARNDADSAIWREQFIRTFVERDVAQLGFQIPAQQLRRFLTMCAHAQGQILNYSKLADSMAMTHPTARRYVDLLEQTFLVRSLLPLEANTKKRLVKSPKVYVRDSGLLHQLLAIEDYNSLMGNLVFGASWEGLVIENVLAHAPDWTPFFYRSAGGDEIDLVLHKGKKRIAIECKASAAPKLTKGFWRALEVVKPEKTFVIAPIDDLPYQIGKDIEVIGLVDFLERWTDHK